MRFSPRYCWGTISTWWWGGSSHWHECSCHKSWGKNHTSNSPSPGARGLFDWRRSGNRLYVCNNCLDWKRCLRALPGAHSVPLFPITKQTRVLIHTERRKNLGEKLSVFLCLNTETGWAELDYVCKPEFLPWTDLFATSFLSQICRLCLLAWADLMPAHASLHLHLCVTSGFNFDLV